MRKETGNALVVLLLALFLAAGCREAAREKTGNTAAPVEAGQDTVDAIHYGPRELSIIDFKALYNRAPAALDLGREGCYVFYKLLLAGGEQAVYSAALTVDGAAEPVELLRGAEYNIAYIAAHPRDNECLITTNYMAPDGHVHNRVWRVGPGLLRELPYEDCEGLPADHPAEALSSLEPFYSWDGTNVVVPTSFFGVSILSREGEAAPWVAMPDPKIFVTGTQVGALPDSGLGRLIYFNVWEARSRDEKCRVFTLDLDKPEQFELRTDQTFVIYEFSSPDLQFEPWVLHGSRLPDYLETRRQVRMLLLDPESGVLKDLEIGGDPEFNIALDHFGTQVAFMDRIRQSLVRLEIGTGEFSIDDRWYSEDASLFFADDDQQVYVWYKDILMQAFN